MRAPFVVALAVLASACAHPRSPRSADDLGPRAEGRRLALSGDLHGAHRAYRVAMREGDLDARLEDETVRAGLSPVWVDTADPATRTAALEALAQIDERSRTASGLYIGAAVSAAATAGTALVAGVLRIDFCIFLCSDRPARDYTPSNVLFGVSGGLLLTAVILVISGAVVDGEATLRSRRWTTRLRTVAPAIGPEGIGVTFGFDLD